MAQKEFVSTGTKGLDFILNGGLPANHACLVRGDSGTGKTTLALQFLRAGAAAGKKCLYLSMLQSRQELEYVAEGYGWSLEGIDVFELSQEVRASLLREQTLFREEDIEGARIEHIFKEVLERYRPELLVFESLSEITLMTDKESQFRRQALKIKQQLESFRCTTLFTDDENSRIASSVLQTILHGAIRLEQESPKYGQSLRRLSVVKMRAHSYHGGFHDFRIDSRGLTVFPRLAVSGERVAKLSTISSGNKELDQLVGGGFARGTTCMIAGSAGVGKSSMASVYIDAAAKRGHRSVLYSFDELPETVLQRSQAFGMDMQSHIKKGLLDLQYLQIGEVTPGQFSQAIRRSAEADNTRIIVIDSITGYMNAMPERRDLFAQLYQLIRYLNSMGLLTFLVVEIHGFLAGETQVSVEASYLTDAVLLLRHFEHRGRLRKCVAAIKKRYGDHERIIREFYFGATGIKLGPPLTQFSGILTGRPVYLGEEKQLISKNNPQ